MVRKYIYNILFIVTLLIWCFALAYPIQPDYDLWARLIAGKSVIENGIILKHDFLSYTPVHEWFDHEWLSGSIFYLLTKLSSFFKITEIQILSAFKSIMTFLIFFIAAVCVYIKKPENAYPPFQILYFATAVLAANVVFASTVRCHMFTFLFFSVWLLILELYRTYKNNKILVILPLSMIIWGNIHGGCLSGLGLLLIYIFGEFFNKKPIKPYVLTLIVSLSALLINPYGIDYIKYLFVAGTMNRSWISEWGSVFSIANRTFKFIVYFIFMVGISLIQPLIIKPNYKNIDKTKVLLFLITAILSVSHAKLIPFFVISSAIFMFDDVCRIFKKFPFTAELLNYKNKYIYAIIILIALTSINSNYKNLYGYINYQMYPYKAVQFMKDNKLTGNLFTEFSYGSYCIYKLYPQNKIFMDGRYEEVYPDYILTDMKNFIKQEGENPNAVLDKYNTDIVLLYNGRQVKSSENSSNQAKVFSTLKKLNWHNVYKDEYFEIYLRPDYPIKTFIYNAFDPLNHSIKMFDTDITKEILLDASKR